MLILIKQYNQWWFSHNGKEFEMGNLIHTLNSSIKAFAAGDKRFS